MGPETNVFEQILTQYTGAELWGFLVGGIIGSLFLAFFGFRFLKFEIVLSAIFAGYSFGTDTLGKFVGDSGEVLTVILGLACATVLALISLKLYKWYIYLIGGCLGASIGLAVSVIVISSFIDSMIIQLCVGILAAILLIVPGAKLMYKIFKPIYVVISAFIGSISALVYLSMLIFGANETMIGVFTLAGVVLAIFAMIFQFKKNKDRELDL